MHLIRLLARPAVLAAAASVALIGSAAAQSGEPIKIGFSMALTGGLGPNGKSALLALRRRYPVGGRRRVTGRTPLQNGAV